MLRVFLVEVLVRIVPSFDELLSNGLRRRLVHVLVVEIGRNGWDSPRCNLPLDGLFNPIRVFRDNYGFFSFFENRGGVDFLLCFCRFVGFEKKSFYLIFERRLM